MKTKKIKLLYLMHVDKKWIKQRPHFLAENIVSFDEVLVLYARANKRKFLRKESQLNCEAFPVFQLPLRSHKPITFFNELFLALQLLFWIIKFQPTHILIPIPDLYSKILRLFKVHVVYDCMDNALGFSMPLAQRQIRKTKEKNLVEHSATLITSSQNLASLLENRYGRYPDAIIRNAFGGDIINKTNSLSVDSSVESVIGYFGTISDWFDFDAIIPSLEATSSNLILAGPCEIIIPQHDRIQYVGVLSHAELLDFSNKCAVLIMPFKINELILSVDPVKIYEYINFSKPIVSVYYPELEHFKDFCYFYNSKSELIKAIEDAKLKPSYTDEQRVKFLMENTWENRAGQLIKSIL